MCHHLLTTRSKFIQGLKYQKKFGDKKKCGQESGYMLNTTLNGPAWTEQWEKNKKVITKHFHGGGFQNSPVCGHCTTVPLLLRRIFCMKIYLPPVGRMKNAFLKTYLPNYVNNCTIITCTCENPSGNQNLRSRHFFFRNFYASTQ